MWFENKKKGYVLLGETLLSTESGGREWSPVSFEINNFVPRHISFIDAGTGWVSGKIIQKKKNTENKLLVLKTTDEGKHWQKQLKKFYPGSSPAKSIDIQFIDETTGWFLTSNLNTWKGELYYTSSSGRKWKKINEIKCVRPTPKELFFTGKQVGWIVLDAGAGPVSGGLLFTRDGGKNFDLFNNKNKPVSMKEIYFTSKQYGWTIGSKPKQGDYLIRTNDGGKTWAQVLPEQ
ncbi:MAG: hypothetical protein K9L17_01045 [Clostridiales bacterium]|nr:hypothetical protein [Clostridiales bacterium]MCF8021279.1 hypothetical protein [Clostridiales bacterium]